MFFVLLQAVISRPEPHLFVDLGVILILILLVGWVVGWLMARRYYRYEETTNSDNSKEIVMNVGCNYRIRIV